MPPRSDDQSINDDAILLRRICNQPAWISEKALRQGRLEPSSAAFLDDTNEDREVSVFLSPPKTVEATLQGYEDFGLVAIRANVVRSVEHIVAITPEETDPDHRSICRPNNCTIGRKSAARTMAKSAEWIVLTEYYRDGANLGGLSVKFVNLDLPEGPQ